MKVYLYCLETKTRDSKFRFFFFEMLLSSPTRVKTARSSPLEFLIRYHHIIVFHRSRSFISAYIVTIRLALSKDSLREEKNNNTVNGDNNRIEKRDRGEKNNKKKKNGDEGCVILRHADAKKIMWNPLKDRRRVLPELFGSKRVGSISSYCRLINFTNACNTYPYLTLFFFLSLLFVSRISRKSWGNDVQCIRRFFSRIIFEEGSIFRSS